MAVHLERKPGSVAKLLSCGARCACRFRQTLAAQQLVVEGGREQRRRFVTHRPRGAHEGAGAFPQEYVRPAPPGSEHRAHAPGLAGGQEYQRPALAEARLSLHGNGVNLHHPRLALPGRGFVPDDQARALDGLMRRFGVAGDVQDVKLTIGQSVVEGIARVRDLLRNEPIG